MDALLQELERILARESELFEKVLSLESAKTPAIMDRDGSELKRLSELQESLLEEIRSLEKDREKTVRGIRGRMPRSAAGSALSELMAENDSPLARAALSRGQALREIIGRLDGLSASNARMIQDNMDFFNIMLSHLKSGMSAETGYGSDGKEETTGKASLLLNLTA